MSKLPVHIHAHAHLAAQGFLHLPADVWSAIGTCVAAGAAVIALLVALVVGLRQLGEADRLRREQAQPYVAVFIDETGTGNHHYDLVVKNFGATAATDVRVKVTPKPRSANLRNSEVETQLKVPDVIPVLVLDSSGVPIGIGLVRWTTQRICRALMLRRSASATRGASTSMPTASCSIGKR